MITENVPNLEPPEFAMDRPTTVEPSDLVSAGDGLMKALAATEMQMNCRCGDFGPCKQCTAASVEAAVAVEAWEEAKKENHSPDCDVNDANLEGIRKPCNCGHNSDRPTCKGTNCGCTDGINHSPECKAEHEVLCNAAALRDHIEHGGWKCSSCNYNGQNNQSENVFCDRCGRHK